MFHHVPLDPNTEIPQLKQITSDTGRVYVIEGEEIQFPSVTTVLGVRGKKAIWNWRRRVGAEKADKISRSSSFRGTQMHKLCENYLSNVDIDTDINVMPHSMTFFKRIQPELNNIDNIRALEKRLFSRRLQLAGTVDCIAEYKGKLSIIDFKSANSRKKESQIPGYFAQGTAYSIMLYELFGLAAQQIVIIVATEDDCQVFIKKPRDYYPYLKESIDMFHRGEYD